MEFIAAKCPNCAGELRLPDDKKQIKCMYCGFDVFVCEAVNAAGTNLENLTRLAYLAETDRNDKEAYEYFKKVLEIDPDNFEALVGKAIAAENSQSLNYETREYEGPPKTWPSVLRAMNELPEDNGEAAKIAAAKRISEKCFGAADEIAHRLDPKNENILVTLYERSKIMALKMDRMGSGYSEFKERYETEASNWLSKLKSLNPEAVPEKNVLQIG